MMTSSDWRTVGLFWLAGSGVLAVMLTGYHLLENRRDRKAREAYERACKQRAERFAAAEMANRIRNERRHHPSQPAYVKVDGRAQKAIPSDQLQLWLTMALEVEKFRKELADWDGGAE